MTVKKKDMTINAENHHGVEAVTIAIFEDWGGGKATQRPAVQLRHPHQKRR